MITFTITRAFRKDENCIPVAYVLQPVSSIFPEVHSSDPDVVRSARTHWTTDIHAKAQVHDNMVTH